MKVILSGYNVDTTVLEELKADCPERRDITPETLSASYARISRDPRPIDQLRAAARAEVDRSRRSNRAIIFKMGHHSVAEHAVFNYDIIGVSRLAIEEIEKFRLGSYTEKSQRYIRLEDDFTIPEEIRRIGKEQDFIGIIQEQNTLYHELFAALHPFMLETYPDLAAQKKLQSVLEGWAKEDARYIVGLATHGQLGMTVNARSLEFMIRRLACKPLAELQELSRSLYQLASGVAPSIILFTDANDYDAKTYDDLRAAAAALPDGSPDHAANPVPTGPAAGEASNLSSAENLTRLAAYSPDPDITLAAALLHTSTGDPFTRCLRKSRALSDPARRDLFLTALRRMEFYDFAPREFEHVDLTFDLVVSASSFAQLKRHRMATLTTQPYDPALGVTIPESVEAVGKRGRFQEVIEKTEALHDELKRELPVGADYVLTNAHRRRALFKCNARELYHFSRLREDATAQWDIRNTAGEMSRQARRVMPLTCLLLGGKDAYPEIYRKVYGRFPALKPPPFC